MLRSAGEVTALLRRVAEGDRLAFEQLYSATSPKLYGVIWRILKRRDLADEITQEVYVKIWQRADEFDPARSSPITWMVTISRNRALDEVRRRQVTTVFDEAATTNARDPGPSAMDVLEQSEDLRKLYACLDGLEQERREAVKLAYLDGFSRQDLADRFGHPVGTIKTWLHRSLKQLKDCLGT